MGSFVGVVVVFEAEVYFGGLEDWDPVFPNGGVGGVVWVADAGVCRDVVDAEGVERGEVLALGQGGF